jgi:hypothetical protein
MQYLEVVYPTDLLEKPLMLAIIPKMPRIKQPTPNKRKNKRRGNEVIPNIPPPLKRVGMRNR